MAITTIKPLQKAPLLHFSVQESLRAYIEGNGLKAGAPLPPEGELAAQLGVSRNSVREGIKALESVGVVETRRGVGVFVKAFSFEALLENLAYGLGDALSQTEEVLVIRRTLEVGLIGRTVELITEDDLRKLGEVVDRMHRRAEKGQGFFDEDREFHQLLFSCQENEILSRLIGVFWLAFHKASDFVNLENSDPMQTWADHAAIVDALVARDAATARDCLDRHYTGITSVIAANKNLTKEETKT